MAKKTKAPGQYAGSVSGDKFYYLKDGTLIKENGERVEPGQARAYAPFLEPFSPPDLKQTFPETYKTGEKLSLIHI